MKTRMLRSALGFAAWMSLVVTYSAAGIDHTPGEQGHGEYVQQWLLVRLTAPLTSLAPDRGFDRATGRPGLDDLIAEVNVAAIEHALAVSMREPKDPAALRRHGLDRTYRFYVPTGSDILELAARFATLRCVEYAEPDYIERGDAVLPDDPMFIDQWSLNQASDSDIDAPEAWEITVGNGVVIGLPDTGVDSDHEDLVGKLLAGYDFVNGDDDPEDDRGHGTRVASVVAANTNNSLGMAGVCWNCLILPVKVKNENGQGTHSLTADGWTYAVDRGARIINHSAGSSSGSETLLSAARYAYDAGVVIVSGTGNGNGPITYPAAYGEVIAVGGTNWQDQRAVPWTCSGANGSNFGTEIDVVAPADWILVADMGGGYSNRCGNSFAAPHVSGLVGAIRDLYPAVGRDETRHLVRAGAEDQVGDATDSPGFDVYYGWGRVNMDRTLQAVQSSLSLQVQGQQATTLALDVHNPVATSYDFVRGDLAALSESAAGVDLGTVVCIENDSLNRTTVGDDDTDSPAAGQGFFYVARFNASPGAGSYGGSSDSRDRQPSGGDCPE